MRDPLLRDRIIIAVAFTSFFVFGPSVLAWGFGAAVGSGGAAAPNTLNNYWSISQNGDAGTSTNSIEFTNSDCTSLQAGTHASGWTIGPTNNGTGINAYTAYTTSGFLSDCGTTRPGSFSVQSGQSQQTVLTKTTSLPAGDFTIYIRFATVHYVANPQSYANITGILASGPSSPGANRASCYMRGTFTPGTEEAFIERIANGSFTYTATAPTWSSTALRPTILLMQKSGTTLRCWMGTDDGAYHFLAQDTAVPSSVGTSGLSVWYGNHVAATYTIGAPYMAIDYIRVVDGNGSYFP